MEIYEKEYESLRAELRDLKECQIKYLTYSATATGLIFGLIARFGAENISSLYSIFYLIPLTIIIPSWLIFFDKATTITRAVSYFRLLESLIIEKKEFEYLGYENSLTKFRKNATNNSFKKPKNKKIKEKWNALTKTGRYWVLVYLSFLGLSLSCIVLTFVTFYNNFNIFDKSFSAQFILITIALMLIWIAICENTFKLLDLSYGKHSYESNYKYWKKSLEVKEKEDNTIINNITTKN